MAAQDVREITPRVRRALEGPVPLITGALTDDELLAVTADAIADVILFTGGEWSHTLEVAHRDDDGAPDEWNVAPTLLPEEESVVAYQAAITYSYQIFKDMKISERIVNEGQEWEYQLSATVMRDAIKALTDSRDRALKGLIEKYPVLARYASILEVRDRLGSAVLEPWVSGGLGGGQILLGPGGGVDWLP